MGRRQRQETDLEATTQLLGFGFIFLSCCCKFCPLKSTREPGRIGLKPIVGRETSNFIRSVCLDQRNTHVVVVRWQCYLYHHSLRKTICCRGKYSGKDNKNQTVRQPDLLLAPIPPIQDQFLSQIPSLIQAYDVIWSPLIACTRPNPVKCSV